MAWPAGNRFWELRSKHGRDKLFATPELMWEAACEYFQWCEEHPFQEAELVTFQGQTSIETKPKMRPFTVHGLCLYLNCSTSYFRAFKSTCQEKDQDFLTIICQIEETIYNQKFSGAASGFLNANLISRDLGLADKQERDLTNAGQPFQPPIINVIADSAED